MLRKTIFILALIIAAQAAEDYYKTLGLKRNATAQEIKKAFKKLSIKYHPDKNRGNEKKAQDMFIKIVNAYEVLKDEEKKKVYDLHGEEGLNQNAGGGGGQYQGANFDDIFSQFFGKRQGGPGGGGGGGQNSHFEFNFGGAGGQKQQQQPKPPKFFETETDIYEIDLGGLSKFLRRNEVWIILFFKINKESEKHKKVWMELAEKYYGIFKVGAVNCSEEEELCQDEFKVFKAPTVLCYPANSRTKPLKYSGNWEIQDLAKFAVSQMESFVQIVTNQNYENFVSEDINRYKVLLFTNKIATPPLFMALSKDLKGKLNFGQVRESEKELINKFNITQFPTLLVITEPLKYEGNKYESTVYKKDQIMKFLREYAFGGSAQKKKETIGLLELNHQTLTNGIIICLCKGHCTIQDSGMCLLYINDGPIPLQQLQMLQEIANFYSEDPIKFIYTTKNSYLSLFPGIKDTPAIVILKPKRQKYIIFTKSVTVQKDIMDSVDEVLSGLGTFQQMNGTLEKLRDDL